MNTHRLRAHLRQHPYAALMALLTLLVGTLQITLWLTKTHPKVGDFVDPERASYTMENLHLWTYGMQGKLRFSLSAPRLESRTKKHTVYISKPRFTLPEKVTGHPYWHGYARYGWINQKATIIKLQGSVQMWRDASGHTPRISLNTARLTIFPKQNRVQTTTEVDLKQGSSSMSGTGMRANLDHNQLEFFDDSHGTFSPRKH